MQFTWQPTRRTAAQMTSRNTDMGKKFTSQSAQALEAQRHSLVQEPTPEMVRKDTRTLQVVSQLTSELQHYHRCAEGKSDEFQAELRQSGTIKCRWRAITDSV